MQILAPIHIYGNYGQTKSATEDHTICGELLASGNGGKINSNLISFSDFFKMIFSRMRK